LLHAKDRVQVHERFRRVDDGSVVEPAEAFSGYVLEDGDVVMLDKKDKSALAPEPSRDIDVIHTVELADLPLSAFSRPYWLGPDGDRDDYFALAAALEQAERVAIVEWVMRKKHHYGALCARGGRLMLVELRSADQWLDVKGLPAPSGATNPREASLAEQLIAGLEGEFDHAAFHDSYREGVQKLIETKARGGRVPKAKPEKKRAAPSSLSAALSASLKAMNKHTAKEKKSA
jgi:DNA end-binding protein Ku